MINQNDQSGVTIIGSEEPSKNIEEVSSTEEEQLLDIDSVKEEPVKEETISESKESNRKQQNVIQDESIDSHAELDYGVEISLPANFDKETRETLDNLPNINLLDNPESRAWANEIAEGLELTTYEETFVPTLEQENAQFKHKLEHDGTSLNGRPPKFKSVENNNLKGEGALIRVITHLGMGTLFQAPLWHSGIWLTFKPASDSEIIELNRQLTADKIRFGRYSYGLVYSNISSYTIDRLIDFALAHVYDLTAKAEDITVNNLKDHISCQDIPNLLWGFICSMYPRGFKYKRACVTDPEKCNFILHEVLNVTKLQWTNVNALTDWQKSFMTGRQSKCKDLASINRYKDELFCIKKKKIVINESKDNELVIILKTPTITEHVESGYQWIGNIVDIVDKTVGLNASDEERNNFITRHGQATAMRQYIHWIDSLEYETNVITDQETIEKTLNYISSDDEVRSEFIRGVVDYINKSTMTVIGIPVFDCPKCGGDQGKDHNYPEHKNIIPLDVVQLFFALTLQRINALIDR